MQKLMMMGLVMSILTACQTSPQNNGVTGYQIEQKSEHMATLRYTFAKHGNKTVNEKRLQAICQQVLSKQKQYTIQILSESEIVAPQKQTVDYGVKMGESRMKFGLSNSPDLHNGEGYAGRQVMETQPSTLMVIRYQCQ